MKIDRVLVRELRDSGLSWEEVEYKYNHETGDNKKSNSLRANYSRYKTVDKDKTIVSNTTIETQDGELLTPEELILRRGLDPTRIRMKSGKSHYGQIGTTKNEEGYLYWVKECKSSLFSKECHVCNKNIKRESFYKVKLYDKHSRQDYKIILCHKHGSEITG